MVVLQPENLFGEYCIREWPLVVPKSMPLVAPEKEFPAMSHPEQEFPLTRIPVPVAPGLNPFPVATRPYPAVARQDPLPAVSPNQLFANVRPEMGSPRVDDPVATSIRCRLKGAVVDRPVRLRVLDVRCRDVLCSG